MKKNKISVAASLGLAQLALLCTAAHAQDTTRVLQDVAISATKVNQKQSQTGKVVTIITRQQIERSAGKTLPELLNEQANVVVNGATSNPTLNKSIYLRGADSRYTLVLLDGILITDPTAIGDVFDLRLIAVDQIDHIEIMKGGQSTLYGSDAVAGVINIVTRKDARQGVHANALLSGGSYGTFKGVAGINGAAKGVSYDVSYTHYRIDGISEAALPENSTAYFDRDGMVQDAVNARLGVKITDRLSVNPFFRYFYNNVRFDDAGYKDADNRSYSRNLNTGTNAIYQLKDGAVNLNYNYENVNRQYSYSGYPIPYLGKVHFADFYLNHQIGQYVKVLVGADNRNSRFNSSTDAPAKIDSSINQFGAYASAFLNSRDNILNLEAGGRYTHHTKFGANWTYSVTPSVNLLKNNQLKLFGTISTSFKAPELYALYGAYVANPDLKPETAQNYEAGASTLLFDNMFNMRIVYYNRHINNAINFIKRYENLAEQNAKGMEVEPSFTFGKLNIKGYYAYLKGNTVTLNTNGNAIKDEFLYRRPKNTFGLFAGYQATSNFYVSVNYRSYGDRYDKVGAGAQLLKDYSLVDAYAEYAFLNRRLKVFVDVKNIFNAKYTEIYGYSTLGTNFNAGLSYAIR
jgi:vitamin B12 transporter